MNLFNCYQALVIFCAMPFGIQWLVEHDKIAFAVLAGVPWLVVFVFIGAAINEVTGK
jgi:hypothetical protein